MRPFFLNSMLKRVDYLNFRVDLDEAAVNQSRGIAPFADSFQGCIREGTVALNDVEFAQRTVLADQSVKANGPLQVLVASNAGVFRLDFVEEFSCLYGCADADTQIRRSSGPDLAAAGLFEAGELKTLPSIFGVMM